MRDIWRPDPMADPPTFTAFSGDRRLAHGALEAVAAAVADVTAPSAPP